MFDFAAITPEGVTGAHLSPDGRNVAVTGPNGKWAVWPLDGGGLRPIPGLESKSYVPGWPPDGASVCATSGLAREEDRQSVQGEYDAGEKGNSGKRSVTRFGS